MGGPGGTAESHVSDAAGKPGGPLPPAASWCVAGLARCSTLNAYSNAAPSHMHVPCAIPITRVCRCPGAQLLDHPRRVPARHARGWHTDSEFPSGPSPGASEVQLRPGRVDQVVVAQPLLLTCRAGRVQTMSTAGCPWSSYPSGRIATALACRNSMPWRR